ncbi:Hypothetical predicted protein, partial [Pelobates cultripes]
MADELSMQRHGLHRPEMVLPGSVDCMIQCLDTVFQRFWQRLEARMLTPRTQHQGIETNSKRRREPGPPLGKTNSRASVKPHPGLPRLGTTSAKVVNVPQRQRRP